MSGPAEARRCWAEIDRGALRHNVAAVRAHLGRDVKIMAVVKANAYGHGLAGVAEALVGQVEMFAVANVREGRELRASVPDAIVYILGPALPEERAEIIANGFIPAVSSVQEAAAYDALAAGTPVPIHLTIDTGMGRIGVWEEDAIAAASAICKMRGVEITGLATHLPSADEDDAFTRAQFGRFRRLLAELHALGVTNAVPHIANSAGLIGFPCEAGDVVRAGLMLYGCAPLGQFQSRLRPVMSWKTRVTLVREIGPGRSISYGRTFIASRSMRVATLAAGYADGYQRHLSGRGAEALIHGQRCNVLGRVTMDQIMVDVTAVPDAAVGDEAVLIGKQGDEEIPVAELARKAGTIPWEIFTGLGARVERIYLESEK